MKRSNQLKILLDNRIFNCINWSELLNFYNNYKSELDRSEIELIYFKSEEYRTELNKKQISEQQITKNGKLQNIRVIRPGMNFKKSEIFTDLYKNNNITNTFK